MSLGTNRASKAARLTFAILMAWTWSDGPHLRGVQARGAPVPGSPGRPTAEDVHRLAANLPRLFASLEAARKEVPRDTFDLQAVIDRQGRDPAGLFAWVRDQTYLVPYRGLLRDHAGVLMDRRGNSLDRALLLLTLMRRAGQQRVRLAFAELPGAGAAKLLDEARAVPATGALKPAPRAQPAALDQALAKRAAAAGADVATVRAMVDQATLNGHRLYEEAVQRTAEQSGDLLELLRQANRVPDRDSQIAALRAEAIDALRQHWWVQRHDGTAWVDFDPSLPTAAAGERLAAASRTVDVERINDELKDEVHKLVIRLVIERWNAGKLEEGVVLTQPLWPCAFVGQRIAIHHVPLHWPGEAEIFAAKDPLAHLKATVLAEREWMPVLTVEDQHAARYTFGADGHIGEQKALPGHVKAVLAGARLAKGLDEGASATARGVAGMLSGGRRKTADGEAAEPVQRVPDLAPKPAAAALTAEWVEYEITAPGRAAQTVRREVFDLLGPAARHAAKADPAVPVPAPDLSERARLTRGVSLMTETEILPQVCDLSPEFLADLSLRNSVANRDVLPELLGRTGGAAGDGKPTADHARRLTRTSTELHSYALLRRQWGGRPAETFLDRVNIVSFHRYVQVDAKGGLRSWRGFDVVTNEIGVDPRTALNPFEARLEQGVLDTNAEALVLAPSNWSENAADLYRARASAGIPWSVTDANAAPPTPQDVAARQRQDVASGAVVVAPEKATSLKGRDCWAWWRIDGRTGSTLGIGERGWGQTSNETMLTIIGVTMTVLTIAECVLNRDTASPTANTLCAMGLFCIALPILFILMILCIFNPFMVVAGLVGMSVLFGSAAAAGAWMLSCDLMMAVGSFYDTATVADD